MSASRISRRFWAAIAAAPAALASATSCGGASSDAQRPAAPPQTDVVVGKSEAPPLEVTASDAASDPDTGPKRRRRACGVDQYPVAQCVDWRANECPLTPPATRTIVRSLFGGRKNGQLDPEWTATAYKGTCCYDWCESIAITKTPNTTCAPGLVRRVECFPMPEKGTTAPAAAPHERCPIGVVMSDLNGVPGSFEAAFSVSMTAGRAQRVAEGAEPCCYELCGPRPSGPIKGRAARHDGEVIVAPAIGDGRIWCDDTRVVPGLTLDDAFHEHASVAAFARLSLSLLAFGAPPDLIADAHRAALDEIRHAQIAFASAGGAIGPGPCAAFGELHAHRTLAEMAAETYRDGCIGETIASLELRKTAPTMADEEARHADLAWRIVEWALASGDTKVRDEIEWLSRTVVCEDDALACWAHVNVIEPCTEILLS